MKKEYYELYWEYLKRSVNYKKYCIWKKQIKTDPKVPLPQEPRKFRAHFEPLFNLFGDIHSETFEKWWKSNKSLFEARNRIRVRDFKKIMCSTFDRAIEQLKGTMGGQASVEDIKQYFVHYLNSFPERALVEIDLWGQETSKELGEQVSKMISPLRKNEKVKAYSRFFNFLNWQPISGKIKKPQSHLKYLEIYDLSHPPSGEKGLAIKKIAARIYPEAQEEEEKEVLNPELLIYQILKLVEKNIKNVEHGRFPGDFEKNGKIKPSPLSPR